MIQVGIGLRMYVQSTMIEVAVIILPQRQDPAKFVIQKRVDPPKWAFPGGAISFCYYGFGIARLRKTSFQKSQPSEQLSYSQGGYERIEHYNSRRQDY